MANYLTTDTDLTAVANAIRTKGGTSAQLAYPNGFVDAIEAISGGGIQGGYNVTLVVDGEDWQVISIKPGESVSAFTNPVKSGYTFSGWSTTSGAVTPDISFPYTPTGDVTLYAVFNTVTHYQSIVTGLGSSSPSSVVFSTNSELVNWNFEDITNGTDIFCKIPTIYRKVTATSSGQITGYTLSSWKEDENFKPYPCFVDEDGSVLPYILIGKYMISSSSVANSVNANNVILTPEAGLNLVRAKGSDYFPYDWRCQELLQDLMSCKKKTVNFQPSTTAISNYMGIYHLDKAHWIYGLNKGQNDDILVSYKPSKYVATLSGGADVGTENYQTLSYKFPTTSGQEIQVLGYDETHPFVNFPKTTTSNTNYNTYYCDGYHYATGNRPVLSYVGNAGSKFGLWNSDVSIGWSNTNGVRLCRKPL